MAASWWIRRCRHELPPSAARASDEDERVIAALHKVDYTAVASPTTAADKYLERQVARWSKAVRPPETERSRPWTSLIDWLPQNIPGR